MLSGLDAGVALRAAENAVENNLLPALVVACAAGGSGIATIGGGAATIGIGTQTAIAVGAGILTAVGLNALVNKGGEGETQSTTATQGAASSGSGMPGDEEPENNKKEDDKWVREPASLQDEMALDAAKRGEGRRIIKELNDPRYKGMDKMEYKVKSGNGKDTVVHYVRDPKTGRLMDFKFKKRSID